ncbi:MAG: Lactate dehydrogenase-like protein dehydrogenase [Candidatus Nomurabacteria bacterium]|nr:Lactate dehydrogenase-like protein dehydrogenase [Candidatus Nomurabacteria bacterium]
MKLIILTPNREGVFTQELEDKLAQAGEVIFKTTVEPISGIRELKTADEKILAIDPDFVNWSFSKQDIDSVVNLKAIILQTTSFGWIDTLYAKEKGIPVTNLRGFSTEAVAEFSLMMTLSLARKLPVVMHDNFRQDFIKHQGVELRGKKVGIIGLGSIGKRFAELCVGVGMEVSYWSQNSRDDRFVFLELGDLIKGCDVIFPALADNNSTKKILTNEFLSVMKTSAMFVSISHKLYDHNFVLDRAKKDELYGYAFEEENGNLNNYTGNILALPALAWATDGSMKKNGELWTEAIANASKSEYPTKIN